MREGEPATASALCASLLALSAVPLNELHRGGDAGELQHARRLFRAHAQGFGLVLLDDHDPHVAPGLHVARAAGPLAPTRVDALARSWEAFDRAFETCPTEQEEALFDARIAPCFEALRVPLTRLDLARDHLFVIDQRYVASFPAERWAVHAARREALDDVSPDHDHLLRALRMVCANHHSLG